MDNLTFFNQIVIGEITTIKYKTYTYTDENKEEKNELTDKVMGKYNNYTYTENTKKEEKNELTGKVMRKYNNNGWYTIVFETAKKYVDEKLIEESKCPYSIVLNNLLL